MSSKWLRSFITGVVCFCGAAVPAACQGATWDQIVPFTPEELWLMKQVRTIIETYQVDGAQKPAKDQDAVYGAIRGMVQAWNDPYTRFVTPKDLEEEEMNIKGEYGGIGLVVSQKDNMVVAINPIDDTPAFRAGFKTNDEIVKVDETNVVGKKLDEVVKMLRGEAGKKVTVWVRRKGVDQLLEMSMIRENIKLASVKFTVVGDRVGYLRLSQFIATSADDLKKAIKALERKKVKGYVLDLRNNGGGLLDAATAICDFFLDDGPIVSTKGRVDKANDSISATPGTLTSKPLVILINGGSASASEIVSGCLRDRGRAILVGEKSFGKGSVQTLFNLADGAGLYVTIARYYTPSGELIDHVGLTPDIEDKLPEEEKTASQMDAEQKERKREQAAWEEMTPEEKKAESDRKWLKALGEDQQLKKAEEILDRLVAGETREQIVPAKPVQPAAGEQVDAGKEAPKSSEKTSENQPVKKPDAKEPAPLKK